MKEKIALIDNDSDALLSDNPVEEISTRRLDACPIIDIVTCGECKWWVKDGNDSFGYAMFCEHDCSLGGQGIKKPTDFCSYGERRAE